MGYSSMFMVTEDGDLSVYGSNYFGQLGIDGTDKVEHPTLIDKRAFGGCDVVMVSAGLLHSACVTSTGKLWMWGRGLFREQLAPTQSRVPMQVFPLSPVLMVACGDAFTMILTRAKEIWTCGEGDHGQLGHNDTGSRTEFTLIDQERFGDGATVKMIAVGYLHSMAITQTAAGDDTLWTWGKNHTGELGRGNISGGQLVPVAIPATTFGGTYPVSMDGGGHHTLVVTADGSLWSCGGNHCGQLGLHRDMLEALALSPVTTLQRVVGPDFADGRGVLMTACGSHHSVVLCKNQTVWVCGLCTTLLGRTTREEYTWALTLIDPALFAHKAILLVAAGPPGCGVVTEDGGVFLWGDVVPNMHAPKLHARIGRWHDLREEDTLAFVMMQDARLGASASVVARSLDDDLLRWMFCNMHFRPRADTPRGLHNLMGRRPVRRVAALDLEAPVVLDDDDEE